MATRTRVPGNELSEHIVHGTPSVDYINPIRGAEEILRNMDNALTEHNDPMQGAGGRNFVEPQESEAVMRANLAQAANLDSGVTTGYPDQVPSHGLGMGTAVNMFEANDGGYRKEPSDSYGSQNTGGH